MFLNGLWLFISVYYVCMYTYLYIQPAAWEVARLFSYKAMGVGNLIGWDSRDRKKTSSAAAKREKNGNIYYVLV